MKRFHVHVAVADLDRSIGFYSTLFNAEPVVRKPDYAKWMIEDPRLNFAISRRGDKVGVNHLGLQVDDGEELVALRDQLERADRSLVEQVGTACCYAKSDKYWIADPQGVAWETFHSLGTIPVYGEDRPVPLIEPGAASACCKPAACGGEASSSAKPAASCC
jgi:catechol 2,3-dioxygenase-like lactoylglutathione lyase family enzyme